MTDAKILNSLEQGVYEICLNRPQKRNALTRDMYRRIVDCMHEAEADDAAKVILVRSSSENFCAGNDLADFLNGPLLENNAGVEFIKLLPALTKPLVVATGGNAVGVGATMLLHADIVYSSSDTVFSFPFIKLGLTPEAGSSVLLAERCGSGRASEWLMTGRNILAPEALSTGLVNHVCVDIESTWQEATKAAQKLSRFSATALQQCKELLRGARRESIKLVIEKELEIFAQGLERADTKAALNAFLNR